LAVVEPVETQVTGFWFLRKSRVRAIIFSVGCRACRDIYGGGFVLQSACLAQSQPTKRAPDAGDSGAIPSLFLRLSLFPIGRRSAARPSAGNANRWALVE